MAQFPKPVKGLNFVLGFAQFSGRGEGFGDGFSIHLSRQAKVGAVGRPVGLMTTAIGFSAAAADGGDGTAAKVTQIGDAGQNSASLLFERDQRFWQDDTFNPNVSLRKEFKYKKGTAHHGAVMSHTHGHGCAT